MKLTVGLAYDLIIASNLITALSDPTNAASPPRFRLTGKARIACQTNKAALMPMASAFEEAQAAKLKELVPSADPKAGGVLMTREVAAVFATAIKELRDAECEAPLMKIAIEDLRLDDNFEISDNILGWLKPIISNWPDSEAPQAADQAA